MRNAKALAHILGFDRAPASLRQVLKVESWAGRAVGEMIIEGIRSGPCARSGGAWLRPRGSTSPGEPGSPFARSSLGGLADKFIEGSIAFVSTRPKILLGAPLSRSKNAHVPRDGRRLGSQFEERAGDAIRAAAAALPVAELLESPGCAPLRSMDGRLRNLAVASVVL